LQRAELHEGKVFDAISVCGWQRSCREKTSLYATAKPIIAKVIHAITVSLKAISLSAVDVC